MTDVEPVTEPAAVATPDLRVISHGASSEDVAAVRAVVGGALGEIAEGLGLESVPTQSAWQRSQRAVRGALNPGKGAWRSFSG